MLVDDDPNDVALLRRALERIGHALPLRVAVDGLQAVDYLAGRGVFADRARHPQPSLVLLDVKLPRQSGLEVLAWVREQPSLSGLRILILTSSTEPSDIRRAYALGAELYLVKPVGFEALKGLARALGAYWNRPEEGPAAFLSEYSQACPVA
ncbi:MAG TPA: response regulator [Planctomycetota bacterium]|nr:response regulator [Planctomycetota bacterium]